MSGHPQWFAIAVFGLVAIAAGVVAVADGDTRAAVASVGVFAGNMTAGVIFVRRARSLPPRERRAWTMVGRGLMIAASGIIVVVLWGVVAGAAPAFGVTDIIFVAGYVFILGGIASLPHTAGDGWQRSRTGLDAAIGAIAIGALAWVFVIAPIVTGLEGAPLSAQVFGTLYPLVDLGIIIAIVLVTTRRTTLRFDGRMLFLAGGVLLQGVGDVSLLIGGYDASLAEAEPLFLVYLAAAAMFLITALSVDRIPQERQYADRRVPLWSMMVPYGAAAVMVLALLHLLWDTTLAPGDRVLVVAALAVAVLVVARQGIAIRENRIVVEQQRSDLVSSISHELRTPLTSMVGFISVLKDAQDVSRSERSEMIGVVADQADYLARIVDDLLTFTHGNAGQIDLDIAERTIAALVENAVLATSIDRKHIDVEVSPTLTALVDGSRIQQILVNLLSNADLYGGDRCLVVATAVGSGLSIEVHDSGPGVPKKHEMTIWKRFERGANRYNAGIPGSGIGLAMVKSLAEAHGGRASYRRSKRLGGACFVIDLPGRVGKQQPIAAVPSSKLAIG